MARFHNINGEHVAFTPEEESERDAEEAAWAAGETDRNLEILRKERNAKLADTDWWAMPDSPTMSEAQTQYRQDLRDFPSTVDINNIVWPTKP